MSKDTEKKLKQAEKHFKELKEIKGIGGWLLLPVIQLFSLLVIMVVVLLFILFDMISDFSLTKLYSFFFGIILSLGINYGCMLLYKKKKKFIKFMIRFFYIELIISLFGLNPLGIIDSIIWIFYFKESVRVKHTFVN